MNTISAPGFQPNDPDLNKIADLSDADGNFIVGSAAGWVAESGATVRTSLGLGTMATQANDSVNINGGDIAAGTVTFSTIPSAAASGTPEDRILWYHAGTSTLKTSTKANVCFLKGTKITLPNKSQKNIEDLTLADEVLTYNIDVISEIKNKEILKDIKYDKMNGRFSQSGIRNIWINPTDSYLVINDKLKITKEHIIHFKRDNVYCFKFAENLKLGDELFTDKDTYEIIESIKEVKENTNVYNFELDKDNTYFAENYLVHHYCKLCSGYSNII